MATTLAPVDSREVVRCDKCLLVQFRTTNNLCRRCRTSLDPEEVEVAAPVPATAPAAANGAANGPGPQVALAIRTLRQRNSLSQRQLALRMHVPRTYVSKIENEKATPTLSSLQRLAQALNVSIPDLLNGGNHKDEIGELLADDFISELVPYLAQLNGMQWQSVMAQMRDMTLHTRRSA